MTFSLSITTPEAIAAEKLAGKRNKSITRRDFCLSLVYYEILTPADAIEAAKGNWPAAMDSFLSFLPDKLSADVQIEWAATGFVDRMHPFVLTMGSWLSLTEAQIDALFGIEP